MLKDNNERGESPKQETVFVDTNSCFDYNRIDIIGWRKDVFPNADEVLIVIVPVINRELGKRKDSDLNKEMRERAASLIRYFNKLFDQIGVDGKAYLMEGVHVYFDYRDPVVAPPLNYAVADDHLIASIQLYLSEHPEMSVNLLTNDLNLKAKCRSYGIKWISLPQQYIAPRPLDEREKKIKLLEAHVEELQNQQPILDLIFNGNGTELELSVPQSLTLQDIDHILEEIKRQHPHIPRQNATGDIFSQIFTEKIDDNQKIEYNNLLDAFYIECESYLRHNLPSENILRKTRSIDFLLTNNGTRPATNVDVRIHFPEGFVVMREKDEKSLRRMPLAPARPIPRFRALMTAMQYPCDYIPYSVKAISATRTPPSRNVSPPKLSKENPAIVQFHVEKLKHGTVEKLGQLYITLASDQPGNLPIKFHISADESPKATIGDLSLIIARDYSG